MNKKLKPIITYEFGTLYIEGQAHKDGDIALDKITFNNLWDFILSRKASDDSDIVMSVHTRGGRKYIKTGRYVGTIQTKNGQSIEILPKIYKAGGQQEKDANTCRLVFLNMLRHFTDFKSRSFQNASLNTQGGFPILEVYISNYVNAVEQLIVGGLKKNYAYVDENRSYLKGKLDIKKQITKNVANKALFAIRYNKYIENIPQNRVVVTTLRKLLIDSHSSFNKAHISALLNIMADIPSSSNIENDLQIANSGNRLFTSYDLIIKWSTQFLLNKGFTTFSGDIVNQSLLFQVENIFEDFIAFLFRKYAPSYYTVSPQNTRYFLVDKHNGRKVFQLRPDIVVEKDENDPTYECIIIDTKWKALDSSRPDRNYLIDIKDMYQLYAYGQKYRQGQIKVSGIDVIPKLVLIYPYTENFTSNLPEFIYDEIKEELGLRLMVVPFNLADSSTYKTQVHDIINCLDVKAEVQPIYNLSNWKTDTVIMMAAEEFSSRSFTTLVGCYKNKEHLEWILRNKLYNIRLGNRPGAIKNMGKVVNASRLLLYDNNNHQEYKVFELNTSQHIVANYNYMKEKDYPNPKPDNKYVLYIISDELIVKPYYDVDNLRNRYAPSDLENGAPFYIKT